MCKCVSSQSKVVGLNLVRFATKMLVEKKAVGNYLMKVQSLRKMFSSMSSFPTLNVEYVAQFW